MLLPRKVSRVDRFVLCSLPTCSQLPTPSFCSRTGGANVGISRLFLFRNSIHAGAGLQSSIRYLLEWQIAPHAALLGCGSAGPSSCFRGFALRVLCCDDAMLVLPPNGYKGAQTMQFTDKDGLPWMAMWCTRIEAQD